MKSPARQMPVGCIALDGALPLFADGEALPDAVFEREIGLTGEYKTRNFALTRGQFEQVIANHKASGVDPAVDRGHETWFGADPGTEARGWVRALSIRPSSVNPNRDALVASIDLNDLGRNAVSNKHFRYLSMGLNLKAVHLQTGKPIGAVLDHLALVKRPFIEGMQPLSLSAGDQPEENRMESLFRSLGVKSDATEAEALTALTETMIGKDAEIKALRDQSANDTARLVALESDAKTARLAKCEADLDSKIAAFAVEPSEKSALLELAAASPEMFSKMLALRLPRDPGGKTVKTAGATAIGRDALQGAAIDAHMQSNKGCDYSTAMVACAMANPDLFSEVA